MSVSGIKAKVRKERVNKVPRSLDTFLLTISYFLYFFFSNCCSALFSYTGQICSLTVLKFKNSVLTEIMLASDVTG